MLVFAAVCDGRICWAQRSSGKRETPRRLMPTSRVGTTRPMSSCGTSWRRLAQQSSTACIWWVFHAVTILASKLSASATASISSARRACAGPTRLV